MSRYTQKFQSHTQLVEAAYLALQRSLRTAVGMLVACAIVGTVMFRGVRNVLGNRIYVPVIAATTLLGLAYTLRNSMVLPALAELRRNPGNPDLLKRWSRGNLIVQGLCAAVGLTGFGLQILGSAPPIPIALYAIAAAYLFLLRPTKP